jgi:hypothetical protein
VLVAVWAGLDGYRRVPLSYGYGPERRAFFAATRAAAEEYDREGTLGLVPEDRWFLLNGWQGDALTAQDARALAQERRARLIVPVFTPSGINLRLDVTALPPPGASDWALELEVGIDGKRLERFSVPGRRIIEVTVPASEVFRGDNVIYLYRVTKRSDPGAWLELQAVAIRKAD